MCSGWLLLHLCQVSDQQWADCTTADIGPPTLEQLIVFYKKGIALCGIRHPLTIYPKQRLNPFNQTIFHVKIKQMPDSLYWESGYSGVTCKFQQYRSRNKVNLTQLHLQSSVSHWLSCTTALDTFATAFHKLQVSLAGYWKE